MTIVHRWIKIIFGGEHGKKKRETDETRDQIIKSLKKKSDIMEKTSRIDKHREQITHPDYLDHQILDNVVPMVALENYEMVVCRWTAV